MDRVMYVKNVYGLVISATLLLAGCSKGGGGSADSSSVLSAKNCKTEGPIDASSLAIKGNSVAQKGAPTNYRLNQPVGCSGQEKVSWNVASGDAHQDGEVLSTKFKAAGQYIVTAEVQAPTTANSKTSTTTLVATKTTVVSSNLALNGPEYGMAQIPANFSVAIPSSVTPTTIAWNFGDGSAVQNGAGPKSHIYMTPGTYKVEVTVTDTLGAVLNVSQNIKIIQLLDGFECLDELAISGVTTSVAGEAVSLSAYIPICIGSRLGGLVWNFGDGTTVSNGSENVTHIYSTPGTYNISLAISVLGEANNPMFTLTHTVLVTAVPEPEDPPHPLACPTAGATRFAFFEPYEKEVTCGVQGKRTDIFHDKITQTCTLANDGKTLIWVDTATTPELMTQGECTGQACELPAEAMTGVDVIMQGIIKVGSKYYLTDGDTVTLYSSQRPEAACSTVQQTRSCNNGVLSGGASFKFLLCTNGCAGFGAHGTVKTGVVVGEIVTPKMCQFGETGITDIFNQIADKTCSSGTVNTTNVRKGTIKTAGSCPVYSWVGTDDYSACTAACGGEQTRIFVCKDGSGNLAPSARCSGSAPVQKRVCDGNPDSVKRTDVVRTPQEIGSSNKCPSNQIGVIVKTREMIVTTQFACVDHSVKSVSSATTYSPWVEERYCRDYVSWRCSHDSLDNRQAEGRYEWMVKCANSVPVIKEFLEKFENVSRNGNSVGEEGRALYPTFMNRDGRNSQGQKCEQPWIAPTNPNAPCTVPSTVYVAAVCVSSCATPDQQILAQKDANDAAAYTTFANAWQEKFAWVATLQSKSAMSSKDFQKTHVDQWISELLEAEHNILEFRMKSGGQIKVTLNHPLIGGDAMMHEASEFKVGDSLVLVGGVRDEIVSITPSVYFGRVYNVFVKSADIHHNIVVTNGYLNGTGMFQNEGMKHLNKAIFRDKLIEGVFEE